MSKIDSFAFRIERSILSVIITILVSGLYTKAQFSLRAEIGQLYDKQEGVNQIGSVGVVSDNSSKPRTTWSLVPSYTIYQRWGVDMRMRYFNGTYNFFVADLEEDYTPFGPIKKGSILAFGTLNLQLVLRFQMLSINDLKLRI